MMLPRDKDSDQGLTLMESLIAMVILGIVMAGSLAFFYNSNTIYYHGLHNQLATWWVNSRMEEIKNAGCGGASGLTGMPADKAGTTKVSLSGDSTATTFTGLRKVTLNCGNPSSVLNDVIVSVSWTEPGELAASNKHNISLETYVGA